MKDRFRTVRRLEHLTQQQMADVLHLAKTTIEKYEYGRTELPDRTIADVCRLFNINEEWLRTGNGDMKNPLTKEEEIGILVGKLYKEDDDFRFKIVKMLSEMSPAEIELLKQMAKKIAESID